MTRAAGTILAILPALLALAQPALAHRPGWHYSPLPGEGDRATLGCNRDARPDRFTCLAVRCEDDFGIGLYIHSSRAEGDAGQWIVTVDRENATLSAEATDAPYGARIVGADDWLLDRLRHGGFVILARADAPADAPHAFIDLTGSFTAIAQALAYCAPRVSPSA